jgi:hypothetical protein
MNDVIERLRALADECIDAADSQDVRDTIRKILLRREVAAREVQRAARYAEILPRCREARDRFEDLNEEFTNLNNQVEPTYRALREAEMALGEHVRRKPSPNDYPGNRELKRYAAETERLEAAIETAQKNCRDLNERKNSVNYKLNSAAAEFGRLAAEERALRPAEEQAAA